jgi:hypothetical protein
MLCRGFKESSEKLLELKEVDGRAFSKLLELWCGGNSYHQSEWSELKQLAAVADRFQVTEEVLTALEDAMMKKLSVEVCVETLTWSGGIGALKRLEAKARNMTTKRFSEVVATAAFMRIEEGEVQSILEGWNVDAVSNLRSAREC